METKIKKVTVAEEKVATTKTKVPVEKFETTDGRKFNTVKEAVSHQEGLDRKQMLIKKFKVTSAMGITLFRVYDNEEDKLMFYSPADYNDLTREQKSELCELFEFLSYFGSRFMEIMKGWNLLITSTYESTGLSRYSGFDVQIYPMQTVVKLLKENTDEVNKFLAAQNQ